MYAQFFSRVLVGILPLSLILLASCAPAATPDPEQMLIGTWTSTVTKEDILRVMPDFHLEALCDNSGTFLWQFNADGTFTVDQTQLPECPVPANTHIEDKWSIDGNRIIFAKDTPFEEVYEWTVEDNTLVLKHISGECLPCKATNTANPWTRVE